MQISPAIQDPISRMLWEKSVVEQPIDCFSRSNRKHLLVPAKAILDMERICRPLKRLIARKRKNSGSHGFSDPPRKIRPKSTVTYPKMPLIAPKQLIGSLPIQGHLDGLPGALAHEVHRNDGRGRDRFLKTGNNMRKRRLELFSIDLDRCMLRTEHCCRLGGIHQLIILKRLAVTNRKSGPFPSVLIHQSEEQSRIEPSA